MASNIIVIGLVPAPDFARFLRELRARYPEATLTAVIGTNELQTVASQGAEECIQWNTLPARALLEELRRRQPQLVAIPYNPEYAITRTYWKAILLATFSRAKGLLFCEGARLPERSVTLHALSRPFTHFSMLFGNILQAIGRRVVHFLWDVVIIILSLPLVLVLLGIMAIDLINALTGGGRGSGRSRSSLR